MCNDQEEAAKPVESVEALMNLDEQEAIAEVRRLIVTAERCESAEQAVHDAFQRLGERSRQAQYWEKRARDAESGEGKQADIIAELRAKLEAIEQSRPDVDPVLDVMMHLPRDVEVHWRCNHGVLRVTVLQDHAQGTAVEYVHFDVTCLNHAAYPSHVIAEAVKRAIKRVERAAANANSDIGGEG